MNPISSRDFAFDDALDIVRDQLIAMLPGRPWNGVSAAPETARSDTLPGT
ncbi:MAG: hypothetical protein OXC31_27520 [Spirochaetaceae bacterium]|nr:hypothetical protein [Spirochaetaceae bacterium]